MSANTGRGGAPFTSSFFRARRRRMHTLSLVQQSYWADSDDTGAIVMNDWMWPVDNSTGAAGDIKIYNGSGWATKPVKIWDGGSWVAKPLKIWNGTTWVATDY